IRSADKALQEHFGCSLKDEGIHILDPFTGTGTFPVRMMESGLIPPDMLPLKYRYELHANEIVLLAYYIAAINIEEAYHRVTGKPYQPFPGICLTDTFQMNDNDGKIDIGLPEKADRVEEQKRRDIRVIVGNPPYSVGQNNANDNNQNLKYPNLDRRIAATYAAHSTATLKNSLYDSYIRAFRWASDRIGNKGVLCFVTNGAWLDSNTADGFRHELEKEFSAVYVFNLRGNQRTSGELSRREGGKIFGSGSRTPVAITLLIKKPGHTGKAQIFYHDIGDYLTREEKLHKVKTFADYAVMPWEQLHPNEHNDWINQRCGDFDDFVPLNDGDTAIFCMRSGGLKTNRDAWCYNFSNEQLKHNIKVSIDFYNSEVDRLQKIKQQNNEISVTDIISFDKTKFSWDFQQKQDIQKYKKYNFAYDSVYNSTYRPFVKEISYFNRQLNNRVYRQPSLFPTANHNNLVIQVTGTGSSKDFSCLISNTLPDLEVISKGQCFPLYHYEKSEPKGKAVEQGSLIPQKSKPKQLGLPLPKTVTEEYTCKDAITDAGLEHFQTYYEDDKISKEDLFYYAYGILHSPKYREKYAADLKKMLPRVPLAPDFWAFSKAGRELAHWHLDYEQVEPWPVEEERKPQGDMDDFTYYHVEKMRFPKKGERGTIIYNGNITFKGIPLDAYHYVVNGKSALDWLMERYAITIDKDSGIRNDPNDWCREHNDPTYIYNLVKRIIRVSLETNRIVAGLPGID
ncbi:type ISP restriction/modification enzyme, partial [Bilophila wadsworthia]